jgi:hypothetical protein
MSVEVKEGRRVSEKQESQEQEVAQPREPLFTRLRTAFGQVEWRLMLIVALVMATAWCLLFLGSTSMVIQILAGIVPVSAGLYLGRRIKAQHLLHGILMGLIAFFMGLVIVVVYVSLIEINAVPLGGQAAIIMSEFGDVSPWALVLAYMSLSFFPLIPFPAFGTVMAGRTEERNRALREQQEARGGTLKRSDVIRTVEDLRGQSLPQLGYHVSNMFKKQGFTFKDYRFIDKDKHLDLWMEREDETWQLRLITADKVRPGTLESLLQDMKKQNIDKGLVITNTEFTPDAIKAAKGRRNVLLIDGETLFQMGES